MTQIVVVAEPRKTHNVSLVGVDYTLTAPKSILALQMATRARAGADAPTEVIESILEWVRSAFGANQTKAIRKRLDDPDDLLDIDHITTLMQKVMEATTATPTT